LHEKNLFNLMNSRCIKIIFLTFFLSEKEIEPLFNIIRQARLGLAFHQLLTGKLSEINKSFKIHRALSKTKKNGCHEIC